MNYQIADLERITGIKAHTIRIWEKRYDLIKPHRTKTNIRYYDDEQAIKLLTISTLIDKGYKISQVAQLDEEKLRERARAVLSQQYANDDKSVGFINALIGFTLRYKEHEFSTVFEQVIKELGFYDGMTKVIYPFLNRLGLMWLTSETFPAQEHFASNLIRRKLMAAIDGIPFPTNTSKKIILFLPPNEWHDIALLFSEALIRSKGYETIYLGQNVPLENLKLVIEETQPTHMLTFFIVKHSEQELAMVLKNKILVAKGRILLIGGLHHRIDDLVVARNIKLLASPSALLEYL